MVQILPLQHKFSSFFSKLMINIKLQHAFVATGNHDGIIRTMIVSSESHALFITAPKAIWLMALVIDVYSAREMS